MPCSLGVASGAYELVALTFAWPAREQAIHRHNCRPHLPLIVAGCKLGGLCARAADADPVADLGRTARTADRLDAGVLPRTAARWRTGFPTGGGERTERVRPG